MIKVTANTVAAQAQLLRVKQALEPRNLDLVVERVALETLTDLIVTTKKAIGVRPDGARWNIERPETKWVLLNPGAGKRTLSNDSKVMRFLDEGTKDHGPTRAKFLFIPLRRRAAAGYFKGAVWGEDFVLARHVRGISPRHIVKDVQDRLDKRLTAAMEAHIQKAING